jgi:hypothetical protein
MKVPFKSGEVTAHKLPDGHVALILPPNAAQFLADIGACIGGIPYTSRRRYSQAINAALADVGYTWVRDGDHGAHRADLRKIEQGLHFENRTDLGDDLLDTYNLARYNEWRDGGFK